MSFENAARDAVHHAHYAACHHGPHFGGIFLGVGLTLLTFFVARAIVRRRRFGRGPRRFVHFLFRRLDTSPSQEKVIREALDELRAFVESFRGEGRTARESLGKSVAGDTFDAAALDALYATSADKLGALRDAVARALARIHEVLTPSQRTELAAILASGPRGFWHGPHRRPC